MSDEAPEKKTAEPDEAEGAEEPGLLAAAPEHALKLGDADEAEAKPKPDGAKRANADEEEEAEIDAALAAQTSNVLGAERFVYAAYLAGAVLAGFVFSKMGHAAWVKLAAWKPEQIGEPRDEIIFPLAGLLGVGLALHYWRRKDARQYASEVAEELSKVTWPTKKEVQTSTFVVVLTTLFATVYFALMDQFWRFITDKVYGF